MREAEAGVSSPLASSERGGRPAVPGPMSVSLVVIRLELAEHSPLPAGFAYSAAGESLRSGPVPSYRRTGPRYGSDLPAGAGEGAVPCPRPADAPGEGIGGVVPVLPVGAGTGAPLPPPCPNASFFLRSFGDGCGEHRGGPGCCALLFGGERPRGAGGHPPPAPRPQGDD